MKLSKELKLLLKDKRIQEYYMEGGWINETGNDEFTVYLKSGYRFRSEECSFIHSEDLEKSIENFELNIDFTLSEANAINYVEIDN